MFLSPVQVRVLIWLGLAVLLWWLVGVLGPVLMPFLGAAVMAYALHPVVERLSQWRVPRWLGAGCAIVLLMLLALAVTLMIVPVVTRQLPVLREQIPFLLEQFNRWLAPWGERLGVSTEVDVGLVRDLLRQLVSGHEGEWATQLLASLRIGGSAAAAVLGNLVLLPVVAYYLLLDWSVWVSRSMQLVPPRWLPATRSFLDETDAVLGQYLRGQLLVMVVLATFYVLALALTGLQLALPIGVFTGLSVLVPYVGFGVGLVLGLLAALLQFQSLTGVLAVAGVYLLGQLLESLYLTPRLLGERIGLHPIAVIFALMVFAHLFGFVGVLMALPAGAVSLVALRRLKALYLDSGLYAAPSGQQDQG